MKFPKLFKNQPKITRETLIDFKARGLITSQKSLHESKRRTVYVANPSAGDVVGYLQLANKLKANEITQKDARLLLAIEATREKGPRQSHIDRLILVAFADDRAEVLNKIKQFSNGRKK